MKDNAIACMDRWQWTISYRLASLSKPAKLILLIILISQTLLIVGLISVERNVGELRKTLKLNQAVADQPAAGTDIDYRKVLDRFNDFLPEATALTNVTTSLHAVAAEAGVTLETIGNQQVAGHPGSIIQRQALRLQLSGEYRSVERFILLALLENDALLLRRWSYQAGLGSATSTLDFELVSKP